MNDILPEYFEASEGLWQSFSEEDTLAFASAFTSILKPGDAIALYGNLGAGKTVFTRGVVKALGLDSDVHSPTYSLVHQYPGPPEVFHIDLYRLEENADFEEIGLDWYLFGTAITLVEWPERAAKDQLQFSYEIRLEYGEEGERMIRWKKLRV